jgi:hypothetical protein
MTHDPQQGSWLAFIAGMVTVTIQVVILCSCVMPKPPTEQSRKAVIVQRNRDSGGRFMVPMCPLHNEPPVAISTRYTCPDGHFYETPDEPLDFAKTKTKPETNRANK